MARSVWKDRARDCADEIAESCRGAQNDRALHLANVITRCPECDRRCPGVDCCPHDFDPTA